MSFKHRYILDRYRRILCTCIDFVVDLLDLLVLPQVKDSRGAWIVIKYRWGWRRCQRSINLIKEIKISAWIDIDTIIEGVLIEGDRAASSFPLKKWIIIPKKPAKRTLTIISRFLWQSQWSLSQQKAISSHIWRLHALEGQKATEINIKGTTGQQFVTPYRTWKSRRAEKEKRGIINEERVDVKCGLTWPPYVSSHIGRRGGRRYQKVAE